MLVSLMGMIAILASQAGPGASPASREAPQKQDGAVDAATREHARLLMLDKSLFTPDERWRYEGSDMFERPKARFGGATVYQAGIVTVGDNRWMPAGAYVKYRVWKAESAEEAHKGFAKTALPERKSPYTTRTVKQLRAGDEARDLAETVASEGQPASYLRRIHIRYGEYLVEIAAYADLKAFGPAPKKGPRPWLCEAPLNRVLQATLDHWKKLHPVSNTSRKP